MIGIVGRSLAITSRSDSETAGEVSRLPLGTLISMRVYRHGPSCFLQRTDRGLDYVGAQLDRKPDVEIIFKHLQHAWLLFSFQENTPIAFSRNRIVLQGEVAHAQTFNRCLARLLALILPKPLARRAMKRYPNIGFLDKMKSAVAIYVHLPLERSREAN